MLKKKLLYNPSIKHALAASIVYQIRLVVPYGIKKSGSKAASLRSLDVKKHRKFMTYRQQLFSAVRYHQETYSIYRLYPSYLV